MIPKKLLDQIGEWVDEKRYGNIQINFAGGKIMSINLNQSVKLDAIFVNGRTKVSAEITTNDCVIE